MIKKKKKSFYLFAQKECVRSSCSSLSVNPTFLLIETILNSQVKVVQHLNFFTFKTEQMINTAWEPMVFDAGLQIFSESCNKNKHMQQYHKNQVELKHHPIPLIYSTAT